MAARRGRVWSSGLGLGTPGGGRRPERVPGAWAAQATCTGLRLHRMAAGSGVPVESTPSPAALMAPGSLQPVGDFPLKRLPRMSADVTLVGSTAFPARGLSAITLAAAVAGRGLSSGAPPWCSRHSARAGPSPAASLCRPSHLPAALRPEGGTAGALTWARSLVAHSLVWGCGACWLRAGGGLALRRPGQMEDPGPPAGQRGLWVPKAIPAWWPCAVCPPCPEGRFHAVKGQSHL